MPTGEPMRALLLVVRAEACGQTLAASAGPTLPDVGGAWAEGVLGADATVNGTTWTWAEGAAKALPGQVLRVVRDTGTWLDYPGIGLFSDPMLAPADKGIPNRAAIGEAKVVSAGNGQVEVDAALSVSPGDRVFLGDPMMSDIADGAPSLSLAGLPGQAFARVLVDPGGGRAAPHHRAVDIVSDNRLPSLVPVTSEHSFVLPPGCSSVTVTATAAYRPVPLGLAKERGWEARDFVAASRKEIVSVP